MKKYKGLALSFLLAVTLLSGCSTSEKEATKESVMENVIKAFNEVESYESEVKSEQEIEMKDGKDKFSLSRIAEGTSLLNLKDKNAIYERELTTDLGIEGFNFTTNTTSYLDFSGKNPTQETVAEDEDYEEGMKAKAYVPEKEMSVFFEAIKESEDISFKEKEETYVFSGEINASNYDAIVGYNHYFVGLTELPKDKKLKDVFLEVELIVDKESNLPASIELEFSELADLLYEADEDDVEDDMEEYSISSKVAFLEIEYSDYNKVDRSEIKSPMSNKGKEKDTKEEKKEDKSDASKEKDAPSTNKEEKEEKVKEATSKENEDVEGPWDSYSFIANEKTYALPLEVSKIKEFGFVIGVDADQEAMEGESYRATILINSDTKESVTVVIHNPSTDTKPVEECQILSIEVQTYKSATKNTFSLPGGVGLGTTEEELNEIYPEYTSFSYSKPIGLYRYGSEYGTFVKVHIRRDSDVVYKFKVSSSGLSN